MGQTSISQILWPRNLYSAQACSNIINLAAIQRVKGQFPKFWFDWFYHNRSQMLLKLASGRLKLPWWFSVAQFNPSLNGSETRPNKIVLMFIGVSLVIRDDITDLRSSDCSVKSWPRHWTIGRWWKLVEQPLCPVNDCFSQYAVWSYTDVNDCCQCRRESRPEGRE